MATEHPPKMSYPSLPPESQLLWCPGESVRPALEKLGRWRDRWLWGARHDEDASASINRLVDVALECLRNSPEDVEQLQSRLDLQEALYQRRRYSLGFEPLILGVEIDTDLSEWEDSEPGWRRVASASLRHSIEAFRRFWDLALPRVMPESDEPVAELDQTLRDLEAAQGWLEDRLQSPAEPISEIQRLGCLAGEQLAALSDVSVLWDTARAADFEVLVEARAGAVPDAVLAQFLQVADWPREVRLQVQAYLEGAGEREWLTDACYALAEAYPPTSCELYACPFCQRCQAVYEPWCLRCGAARSFWERRWLPSADPGGGTSRQRLNL